MINVVPMFNAEDQSNSYFIFEKNSKEAIIVNPSDFTLDMLAMVEKHGYVITGVFLTHHNSHNTRGLTKITKIYNSKIYSSQNQINKFNCELLNHGDIIKIAGLEISVYFLDSTTLFFIVHDHIFVGTISDYQKVIAVLDQDKYYQYKVYPFNGTMSTIEVDIDFGTCIST